MRFHDREEELHLIGDALRSDHCFVVVTGRRRIGKTRLIREALRNEDHLDLFIPRKRKTLALDQLSALIREQTGYSPNFGDFRELLEYVFRLEKKVIFLDEISNLDHVDKGAFSDLQEVLDRMKMERSVHLIVDGSYAGVMKRTFEDRKEPLFGRATNILKLGPLPLEHSIRMLMDNGLTFEDSIEAYSLFGGIPRYLELLENYNDMKDIAEGVFTPGSIFLYEGENVLIQEFGSSWDTYFSILEVISGGKLGPTEIANKLGMEVQMLPKYLETLKGLNIVERKRPIFGKQRHVRYSITDPFFRFWFEACYPRIGLYRDGRARVRADTVRTSIGRGMEKVVADLLFERDSFPFEVDQVGSWWDRSGHELDIIFFSKKQRRLGAGEVKWRNRKVGVDVVERMIECIDMVDWYNGKRKEYPFIVSKAGFTDKALKMMDDKNIRGFTMDDIRTSLLEERGLDWGA